MIPGIDAAIRDLLFREIPLRKSDVDISFDQPRREWASQLNKPTLNLYLFDIKENVELRGSEQFSSEKHADGTVTLRRNAVRMDLYYLITAWTRDIQDQHRLLAGILAALIRNPTLPEDITPELLKGQPLPVRLKTAQPEVMANITDLWSTLDNEIRPGIRLLVTFTLDPYIPEVVRMVETTEMRFFQTPTAEDAAPAQPSLSKSYLTISGRILSQKYSFSALKLTLKETGQEIPLTAAGEFIISRMQEGEYHLDVWVSDRVLKEQIFHVPSSNYVIEV